MQLMESYSCLLSISITFVDFIPQLLFMFHIIPSDNIYCIVSLLENVICECICVSDVLLKEKVDYVLAPDRTT